MSATPMALRMATRRAAAASSNSLGRIYSCNSAAALSTSRFVRYFSDSQDCTITACGNYFKRSHEFDTKPGICDPHTQNPFQTLGLKGAYEVKQVEKGLFLRMEMPGINKDDVKILVDNEDATVHVKGEGKKESTYEENGRAYNFRVRIPPHHYMFDQKMEVELKNGVLRMLIPKATSPEIEAPMKDDVDKIVISKSKTGEEKGRTGEAETSGGVETPKPVTPQYMTVEDAVFLLGIALIIYLSIKIIRSLLTPKK